MYRKTHPVTLSSFVIQIVRQEYYRHIMIKGVLTSSRNKLIDIQKKCEL